MKSNNLIQTKSYEFSLLIISLYKYIVENKKEFILSKQLLKSGTSIAANVEEAIGAQSDKDFIAKISIAYKEARETHYWIRLLSDTKYIDKKFQDTLFKEIESIIRILGSIQKTMKSRFSIRNS